jgi:hypothetical protein
MDTDTQNIIISYINNIYEMNYYNMVRYQVEDLTNGQIVSLQTVWNDIESVFGLTNLQAGDIFKLWVDEITNKFQEMQSVESVEDKSLLNGMIHMVKLRTQYYTNHDK